MAKKGNKKGNNKKGKVGGIVASMETIKNPNAGKIDIDPEIVKNLPVTTWESQQQASPIGYETQLTAAVPQNTAVYNEPEAYQGKYDNQIADYVGRLTNREAFSYDPLQDASYQALAKVYNAKGNTAARDTMGDAAALNGGYGSSYSTIAAAQARNQYNQELAGYIPQLEQNAYDRYMGAYDMDLSTLGALQGLDEADYSKYRDTVADAQWKYNADYNAYRDSMADYQWGKNFNLQDYETRANVRNTNAQTKLLKQERKQNKKKFKLEQAQRRANVNSTKAGTAAAKANIEQTKASTKLTQAQIKALLSKSSSSGSGGGGGRSRSRGGSGGGYYSSGSSSSSSSSSSSRTISKDVNNAAKEGMRRRSHQYRSYNYKG